MGQKAALFNDDAALQAILKTANASKQKELGRSVKGFNDKTWFAACDGTLTFFSSKFARGRSVLETKQWTRTFETDIVFEGNLAKFSQQPNLKKLLLATGDRVIVEASPKDTIWGIGLAPDDNDCLDPSKWKGLLR